MPDQTLKPRAILRYPFGIMTCRVGREGPNLKNRSQKPARSRTRFSVQLQFADKAVRAPFLLLVLITLSFASAPVAAGETIQADVCIYGGTAAGVAAAVQVVRMGKTAVIAEFGNHVGGMTSGGLGATDIGNKAAIGGIARELYHRIAQHYSRDEAWRLERKEDYFKKGSSQARQADLKSADATMWTFEP